MADAKGSDIPGDCHEFAMVRKKPQVLELFDCGSRYSDFGALHLHSLEWSQIPSGLQGS